MSPICNTAALASAPEIRLRGGGEARRNEVPGAIVASASISVSAESDRNPASNMVASGSDRDGLASTRVATSWGGMGTLLPELSPAKGVPTPGIAGFLADFPCGRNLESSMLGCRNGPEIDETKTPANTPAVAS